MYQKYVNNWTIIVNNKNIWVVYEPQEHSSVHQWLELYKEITVNLYISIYNEQHIYMYVHTHSYWQA